MIRQPSSALFESTPTSASGGDEKLSESMAVNSTSWTVGRLLANVLLADCVPPAARFPRSFRQRGRE